MGWMGLLDENDNEIGMVGDYPWDIMEEALKKIEECYQEHWHRKPTSAELISIFEFSSSERLSPDKETIVRLRFLAEETSRPSSTLDSSA